MFSGIGGFDLAAKRVGIDNIFQVENDSFCKRVLEKNFPKVNRHADINSFNGKEYAGKIDIISGGFPCQPFSFAGKRKGEKDNRHLWPQMLRVIQEIKPNWVVGENVAGIISMALHKVLSDLENSGYSTQAFVIPACAKNAPHRRDRVWIIATRNKFKRKVLPIWKEVGKKKGTNQSKVLSNSACLRQPQCVLAAFSNKPFGNTRRVSERRNFWSNQPRVLRVADGVPKRVDRIKALGNAIVPQVAEEIFKTIQHIHSHECNKETSLSD